MSYTNFPHGVTSFGIPQLGNGVPIAVPGNVYWVHPASGNASDSNAGTDPLRPLSTLSRAHALMTANQNDVAILIGNSSAAAANVVTETSSLAWSKSLCHIIGTAHNRVAHRVSLRGTAPTNLWAVSAQGCVFANFHVNSANAGAVDEIALAETGQRNSYYNMHITGMIDSTASGPFSRAGARHITLTGDGERFFKDCVIGNDTVGRSAANANIGFLSAAVRDWFEDCMILCGTGAATPVWINANASGAIDRWIMFKRCQFFAQDALSGGTQLTQGLSVHAAAGGALILNESHQWGAAKWETTASTNVILNNVNAAATSGLQVANTN